MTLVWYHIPSDKIIVHWKLDGYFFALMSGFNWKEWELLGEL